jgi:hypothetical protein
MAKRDIVDEKARNTIPGSGLGEVLNSQAWGAAKAVERYGAPRTPDMRPPEGSCYPQRLGDANNLQGPGYRMTCRTIGAEVIAQRTSRTLTLAIKASDDRSQ